MAEEKSNGTQIQDKPNCGVIMPISAMPPTYTGEHWEEVLAIITEALEEKYTVRLVSNSDDARIIQNTIVKNLIEDDMIICDVSGQNPNVMFELGLRMAINGPVVIIKDEKTPYNFDTQPVEHLGYSSDLRYQKVNDFKEKLLRKVLRTQEVYKDPEYKTFFKTFGIVTVPRLESKEVSSESYMIDLLEKILSNQNKTFRNQLIPTMQHGIVESISYTFSAELNHERKNRIYNTLSNLDGIIDVTFLPDRGSSKDMLIVKTESGRANSLKPFIQTIIFENVNPIRFIEVAIPEVEF